MQSKLISTGYEVLDGYLSSEGCQQLLSKVGRYRQTHELAEIYRPIKDRPLRYYVIDGEQILEHLPDIWNLYQEEIRSLASTLAGQDLEPLANARVGVNVNIMPPGRSSYRWHYDRCSATGILYLNEVEGGQTELYPNYRLLLKKGRHGLVQRWLDKLVNVPALRNGVRKMAVVRPLAGRLVMMRGNRCWHSVRPVLGNADRINIIFSFDRPGAIFPMEQGLDSYLYTRKQTASSDPNYAK